MPPVPWSPIWSMGMTMSMSSSYASANASFPHGWNMAATLPNYPPCNYWVTAWPTPCPFPLPITPVSKPNLSSRASVEEIEDVATTSCQGTPPAASLLPRPSLTMTASLVSEEEISKSNPIKSRIAAQFRNPVKPIDWNEWPLKFTKSMFLLNRESLGSALDISSDSWIKKKFNFCCFYIWSSISYCPFFCKMLSTNFAMFNWSQQFLLPIVGRTKSNEKYKKINK